MDLVIGRIIRSQKMTVCAMTCIVSNCVDLLVEHQGHKMLKFFRRKKEEIMVRDADLLAGVRKIGWSYQRLKKS